LGRTFALIRTDTLTRPTPANRTKSHSSARALEGAIWRRSAHCRQEPGLDTISSKLSGVMPPRLRRPGPKPASRWETELWAYGGFSDHGRTPMRGTRQPPTDHRALSPVYRLRPAQGASMPCLLMEEAYPADYPPRPNGISNSLPMAEICRQRLAKKTLICSFARSAWSWLISCVKRRQSICLPRQCART